MQDLFVKVLRSTILAWGWEKNFLTVQALIQKKPYSSAIDT